MGKADDRSAMENHPGLPPLLRRWAAEVNAAVENKGGSWVTTTTTSTTSTTTTSTTTTSTTTTSTTSTSTTSTSTTSTTTTTE